MMLVLYLSLSLCLSVCLSLSLSVSLSLASLSLSLSLSLSVSLSLCSTKCVEALSSAASAPYTRAPAQDLKKNQERKLVEFLTKNDTSEK
jgi:hypothetical protein